MAKKNLSPKFIANKFKPGQSGNPGGRSPDEKKLLSLTKQEVARLLNMVCDMTLDEMQIKFNNPKTKAIEKLFIKTIIDGLKGDSVKAAEFLLTRTIGKPKDDMQVTFLRRVVKKLDGTEVHYTNEPEGE